MIQMRALRYTHLHMDSQVGIRVINHAWETIERSPLESRLRTLLPWEPSSPSEGSPRPSKMADHSDHYWSVYESVIINLGLLSLPSWPPVSASQAIAYANLCNRLCNLGRLSLPSWATFFSGLTPRYQGCYISLSALSIKTSLSKWRNQTKNLSANCWQLHRQISIAYIKKGFPWNITNFYMFYRVFIMFYVFIVSLSVFTISAASFLKILDFYTIFAAWHLFANVVVLFVHLFVNKEEVT